MSQASASMAPVKLSLGYKVIWGIAALGTSLISGIYGALLPIFYQDYLGLTARWIALASAIYAIWNAINDPLFGYITDLPAPRCLSWIFGRANGSRAGRSGSHPPCGPSAGTPG